MQRNARMKRELRLLAEDPPHGASCWPVDENRIDKLEAKLIGAEGTPYHKGIFKLDIQIPERYPFEPPKVRFVTPIYHPNIDSSGRICLDTLKMPPKGMWKPALNISSVLSTILILMAEPNPDDPLMAEISNEFKYNKAQFLEKAKEWTLKFAMDPSLENKSECANVRTNFILYQVSKFIFPCSLLVNRVSLERQEISLRGEFYPVNQKI
ncbi:predicted protein [Nematostella vectensis]|uniref:Ubiquitin-conjugating enzyme E2 T n=1 Tax=Nematostella vectensis TaxID=45351 RepID=A7RL90_NEMVE|nr:predicted protein [Nematostella vectensis]|eukprot:XP_001639950.1 predicted protein [Nematostella vectensis]